MRIGRRPEDVERGLEGRDVVLPAHEDSPQRVPEIRFWYQDYEGQRPRGIGEPPRPSFYARVMKESPESAQARQKVRPVRHLSPSRAAAAPVPGFPPCPPGT